MLLELGAPTRSAFRRRWSFLRARSSVLRRLSKRLVASGKRRGAGLGVSYKSTLFCVASVGA